jgi:dephospho-CoA kinase
MRVWGLTGGAGSGKSEAARHFIQRGIPVLNADEIGHELLAPGGGGEEAVVAAFGTEILTEGQIDRQKLGGIVFADADALVRLNAIVHPLIRLEIKDRCKTLAGNGQGMVIIDAALIAEDGKRPACLEGLILVACSRETRMKRLVEKRGFTEERARRCIEAQTPPEEKLALADMVLENEESLDALCERVDAITKELTGSA